MRRLALLVALGLVSIPGTPLPTRADEFKVSRD